MAGEYRDAEEKSHVMRNVIILMVIAFIGGAIATSWILSRYNPFASDDAPPAIEGDTISIDPNALSVAADAQNGVKVPVASRVNSAAPAARTAAVSSQKEVALSARVQDLEDRLSRINVQAQAASGNATRAEGLLLAFAARRALDKGSPLGYIEAQLRLRFGDAQPIAVSTIVSAAQQPVTLEDLVSGLNDLGPSLIAGSNGNGDDFWGNIQREISTLFVVRGDGSPSPEPQQRLSRAERFVESGNLEAAIAEVEKLPGREKGEDWVQKARRYNEARRALDVIETAAILEPQQLRSTNAAPAAPSSALIGSAAPE